MLKTVEDTIIDSKDIAKKRRLKVKSIKSGTNVEIGGVKSFPEIA